jgi:transcriptional regulator GlxA family with amidase domain
MPRQPLHVSLIAVPEAMVSTLSGIYDVLNGVSQLMAAEESDRTPYFTIEIVALQAGSMDLASGLPIQAGRAINAIQSTDLVIVPSLLAPGGVWQQGRYPEMIDWMQTMYQRGALLCSACSGLLLLAETGLFDRQDSTIHWSYIQGFQRTYPNVRLLPERSLVVTGDRERLISSGAATSWHDLVLYLIARFVGPSVAQSMMKFYALQWHQEGQTPYIVFNAPDDHGDAIVAEAQTWLAKHYSTAAPVEEMVRRSGLAERSFKRRFTKATGYAPIAYVQQLRIEEGKRRLERTDTSIDQIAWQVGYEDPAFFRRLFRRITGVAPGAYRRKFQLPE